MINEEERLLRSAEENINDHNPYANISNTDTNSTISTRNQHSRAGKPKEALVTKSYDPAL